MITADTIKCTIPSDNAVKVHELYCNVAYPVASADSAAWAAWATALFTLLLAVFAWFAWESAKAQLKEMRSQAKKSADQAADAILAASSLESQRYMNSALFDYLSAHAEVVAASSRTLPELDDAGVNLRKACIRFILVHEFRGRSGEISNFDDLILNMAVARIQAQKKEPGGVTDNELAYGLGQGFNMVNNQLRDFYQGRIEAPELHSAFKCTFSELAHTYRLELPKNYIDLIRSRGWIE